MAEWFFERGIGEYRAVLVEADEIVEARIELPGPVRAGAVVPARLSTILVPGRRGIVSLEPGGEALIEPLPRGITEGAALAVEVVREAIPEAGRPKLPKCRASSEDLRPGPSLLDRIRSTGTRVVELSHFGPDRLEAAGWAALLEEASTGELDFPGGGLRMSITPAMTLFDVDGPLPPAELALAGARAAAQAIRRFDIGGSIGIDLPTLSSKQERQDAASAVDAILPEPFERTAVNGFGFLQIVRKRERASLPEIVQGDRVGAAARLLLRRAERSSGTGERTLHAAPEVIERIRLNPEWMEELHRRIGTSVVLREEPGLAISAGHVQSRFV